MWTLYQNIIAIILIGMVCQILNVGGVSYISDSECTDSTDDATTTRRPRCPKTFLYFAYGSNLWSKRLQESNPSATKKYVGLLPNYTLEFGHYSKRWRGGVANINPDPTSHVYGVLWELKIKELQSLDRQEGVGIGIYERFKANITVDDKQMEAWTYKLTEKTRMGSMTKYGRHLRPSVVYKDVILRGAYENNLPSGYIDRLKTIPSTGLLSDCGGLVTIRSTSSPIIDYRGVNGKGKYGNNERCVWVIVPEPSLALETISIYINRQDFEWTNPEVEPNDGLIFYDSELNSQRILRADTGKFLTFNTSIGFLYFSSEEVTNGVGFKVTIVGREKAGTTVNDQQGFWLRSTDCGKSFTYPPPNNDHTITSDVNNVRIVIQPDISKVDWNVTNVSFKFENSVQNLDQLKVFTLPVFSKKESLEPRLLVEESRSSGINQITFNKITASTPRIISYNPNSITGSIFVQQFCNSTDT